MSEIVIYGFLGSPFVRSAQLCLEEKEVPYRVDALRLGGIATTIIWHVTRSPGCR